MNPNWVFSKRGPYTSPSSPWPANVNATTTSHDPASYVLVIRPRSISWKLVRTVGRTSCLTSPTANYNKGANIRRGSNSPHAAGALPMHICDLKHVLTNVCFDTSILFATDFPFWAGNNTPSWRVFRNANLDESRKLTSTDLEQPRTQTSSCRHGAQETRELLQTRISRCGGFETQIWRSHGNSLAQI